MDSSQPGRKPRWGQPRTARLNITLAPQSIDLIRAHDSDPAEAFHYACQTDEGQKRVPVAIYVTDDQKLEARKRAGVHQSIGRWLDAKIVERYFGK